MPQHFDAARPGLAARPSNRARHIQPVPVGPLVGASTPVGDDEPTEPPAGAEAHPAGAALAAVPVTGRPRHLWLVPALEDESGSLVAEYGLLVVLGATITMLATKWASGGAIWSLFGSVLDRAKALVGV